MDRTAGEEHAINFGRKEACLYSAEVPPSVPSDYEAGINFPTMIFYPIVDEGNHPMLLLFFPSF
jgi:hypothetical protein